MFSREEYYKLFNSRVEGRYQEVKKQLEQQISELSVGSDKGFRERMTRYSKTMAEYLVTLCQLEEGRTEEYLKSASMKDLLEDQNHFFGMILKENYLSGMASTTHMNTMVRDIGPALAMFTCEFIKGAEDAIKHRRFQLLKKMELYFEMHKRISKGQVRAEQLAALLRDYTSSNAAQNEEMRILERYSPADETNTRIVREANLIEPYYLYELGTPVGEMEKNYQKFFVSMAEEKIEELAEKIVDGFIGSIGKEIAPTRGYRRYNGFDRSYESSDGDKEERIYEPDMVRNLVAIDYPLGCELLSRKIMEKLEEKGYPSFVREITTTAISEAYKRDHQGDVLRSLDKNVLEKHEAVTEKISKENKCLLKSYAGAIVLQLPEEKGYQDLQEEMKMARSQGGRIQRPTGRYSIGAAEEKRKLYREYLLEEEAILRKTGLMESAALMHVTLPAFEEENFQEKFDTWMQIQMMEHHGERSLKAFSDALDKGSFVYLQGGKELNAQGEEVDNETDLLIALRPLKDASKETKVQINAAGGSLPSGSLYTIPQMVETSGVLHMVNTVIDGVSFQDLKLTFEDGVLKDYSAGGFEDPEEGKKFVREKLLHGGFEANLAEFAMGIHSGSWDSIYTPEMQGDLPESLRSAFDISIVLGESCMERDDFARNNNVNRKKLALYEAEVEEAVEEAKEEAAPAQVETAAPAEKTEEAEAAPVAPAEENQDSASENAPKAEAKEEPRRRRYSFPLRRRISIPYSTIGSLKVINENGSFNDIYRGNTFVLIGTDPLNVLLFKGKK